MRCLGVAECSREHAPACVPACACTVSREQRVGAVLGGQWCGLYAAHRGTQTTSGHTSAWLQERKRRLSLHSAEDLTGLRSSAGSGSHVFDESLKSTAEKRPLCPAPAQCWREGVSGWRSLEEVPASECGAVWKVFS